MSKSKGDILRVVDLKNKGYDPLSYRYFILNTYYHKQVNFSFDALDSAEVALKKLRNKAGLTQKDLANQLHVTYQAVSRWENDDVEPSIGTLKEMCGVLNCSIEELLEIDKKDEQKPVEEKVTIVEKMVAQEPKPVLGVSERCNKPIYEAFK